MNNSKNAGQQDNTFESRDVDSIAIESLIASFSSKGVPVRIKARQSLIAIGGQAVAPLVNALANRNKRVRWEASKALGEIGMDWGAYADSATITALIADLGSKDGLVRVRARKSLVAIGDKAVRPLVETLASKKHWVRWEAAKALGQIADPSATAALLEALEDRNFDIRWLAAEGLINIGREALAPLLHALIEHSDSIWLREGAHHIFHDLAIDGLKKVLKPVLNALEDMEPSLKTPPAAEIALDVLERRH